MTNRREPAPAEYHHVVANVLIPSIRYSIHQARAGLAYYLNIHAAYAAFSQISHVLPEYTGQPLYTQVAEAYLGVKALSYLADDDERSQAAYQLKLALDIYTSAVQHRINRIEDKDDTAVTEVTITLR